MERSWLDSSGPATGRDARLSRRYMMMRNELLSSTRIGTFCMAAALAVTPTAGAEPSPHATGWIGSWAASPQPLADPSLAFDNVTLRQIIHLTVGGRAVRLRLDNTFGDEAVTFADVHVGVAGADGAIRP